MYKRSPRTPPPPPPPPLPSPSTPTSEESPPPPPKPPPPSPTSEDEGIFSYDSSVLYPTPPHQCEDSDTDPPADITVEVSQGGVRSNLSGASPATPQTPLSLLTPDNMGLPLTPLCRVMGMPSEAILEEGYDSNLQFGPFIQDGLVEEEFASMDEEEKTVIEVVTAEPGESEEGKAVPVLTSDGINKMKVMEL